MHDNNSVSTPDQGFRGGLAAALVVFALTWFVVNGAEVPQENSGALDTQDHTFCAVPKDIPTSRFLNAPVLTAVPWIGA